MNETGITTKELAEMLNTTKDVILSNGRKCFPHKQIEHGKPVIWSEAEATVILDHMKSNISHNASVELNSTVNNISTSLTNALKIQKAMLIMQEAYEDELRIIKAENEKQKKSIELMTPLAEFGARVGQCKELLTVREAAKVLNLGYGVQTFYKKLVADGYLMGNHEPYQEYINKGYFRVVESSYNDGWNEHLTKTTKITQKGLEFLSRKYGDKDAR